MEELSIFDLLRGLALHINTLETVIKGFAYVLALILIVHGIGRLYKLSSGDNNSGSPGSILVEFVIAGALASFGWSLQLVGDSAWGKGSLIAYTLPTDAKTASEITLASIVAGFMILRIFGYGWFIQSLMRLKAISTGRQANTTVGGAVVQMLAAAALVNLAWVIALFQASAGFKTTVLDLLKMT